MVAGLLAVVAPVLASSSGVSTTPEGTVTGFVEAGAAHTCGIRTSGNVACWGDNSFGQASDYTTVATDLTWNGVDPLTKFVTVLVSGDTTVEPNETFVINLSSPSPAGLVLISDAHATATIVNDD